MTRPIFIPVVPESKALRESFWRRVRRTDGCWLWVGSIHKLGYGSLRHPELGGTRQAHRVAWMFTNGPIPDGLYVCHHCDTPACVNPSHLFLGTQVDNVRDAIRKGRFQKGPRNPGERNHFHKLTEDQAREIIFNCADQPVESIAARFGICHSQVKNILAGRHWKHLHRRGQIA